MDESLERCLQLYEDTDFYDQEFADRTFEIPFFLAAAQRFGSPVLELGCGSGRITIPLARAGVDIDGIDLSESMLDRARARAKIYACEQIRFFQGDFSQLETPRTYRLIFCATNALQHLLHNQQIDDCFQAVRRCLAPAGLFLIDVFNPDATRLARTWNQRYLFKEMQTRTDGTLSLFARSEYAPKSRVLRFQLDYRRQADDRQVKVKDVEMRCLFPTDLAEFCRRNGFTVVDKWGSYDSEPFTENSAKQILVCQAADNP